MSARQSFGGSFSMQAALWRRFLTRVSIVATALIAAALAAGFLGRFHPFYDSFSHFRAHLAVLLMIAPLPLLFSDHLKVGAAAIGLGILALATTSGTIPVAGLGMAYGPLVAPSPEQPVYRLMQINLRYDNRDPAQALSLIGRVQPDIVTLNEVSKPWAEKLELLAAAYPYRIVCSSPKRVWGVAILSRRPLVDGTTPHCENYGSFATMTVNLGGRQMDIAALHLDWPWPYKQDSQIDAVTPHLQKIGSTALLAGDMNAAPWSHSVARVAAAGGFALMPSRGASYMALGVPEWLHFAGLSIDQVFAKGDVAVHGVSHLESVASDHIPVLVEFSLKPAKAPAGDGKTATARAELAGVDPS